MEQSRGGVAVQCLPSFLLLAILPPKRAHGLTTEPVGDLVIKKCVVVADSSQSTPTQENS